MDSTLLSHTPVPFSDAGLVMLVFTNPPQSTGQRLEVLPSRADNRDWSRTRQAVVVSPIWFPIQCDHFDQTAFRLHDKMV